MNPEFTQYISNYNQTWVDVLAIKLRMNASPQIWRHLCGKLLKISSELDERIPNFAELIELGAVFALAVCNNTQCKPYRVSPTPQKVQTPKFTGAKPPSQDSLATLYSNEWNHHKPSRVHNGDQELNVHKCSPKCKSEKTDFNLYLRVHLKPKLFKFCLSYPTWDKENSICICKCSYITAVIKSPGLPVHPHVSNSSHCLANQVKIPGAVSIRPLHRLDTHVGGVVICLVLTSTNRCNDKGCCSPKFELNQKTYRALSVANEPDDWVDILVPGSKIVVYMPPSELPR